MASVSVIVPTYNYGPYIRQAIDSLLAQTRVPDQIIIVNDGSTDDTAGVVSQIHDSRLVYVEQENSGVSVTRNHGLSIATGDFIGFLDADDRWRPTMLEKQLAILEGDGRIACSFTNFERFEERTGRALGEQFRQYPELATLPTTPGAIDHSHVLTGDAFCEFVAFGDIPAFTQVMMFRGKLIDGLRFNHNLHLGEDTEFALKVFMKGRVAYTSEVLADVRRHGGNATTDYHWMPVHRLRALKAIGDVVGPGRQRVAYRDRLVKAHIDAAVEQCRRGQVQTALSTYAEGLSVPGSLRRKVRGGARLAVTFLGGSGGERGVHGNVLGTADVTTVRERGSRGSRVRGLIPAILFVSTAIASAQTPAQPVPNPPAHPSVASLVLDLGSDIRNLPTLENALVLGSAGAVSFAVHGEDADLTRRFSEWAGDSSVFDVGDVAGELSVQFGTAVTVYAVGRLANIPGMSMVGADLVRAQILNTVVTHGTKAIVNRDRPDGAEHSFPSGHASSTFATAAVLQRHLGWKVGLPACGLAVFTGASRMAQNKHYLSDVIFGAAIGVVMGRTTTIGHGPMRFAVTPLATPGGVGIGFVRRP